MILDDIHGLMKIKIKSRDDTILDQYSRLFMVRLFSICGAVCGISWYADKLNCIVPGFVPDSDEFQEYAHVVDTTCWIQGLFIYRGLATRIDDVAYYGLTKDIDMDGQLNGSKELCGTYNRLSGKVNEACEPMEKTFFQQYQYMPFLFGAIALAYYLPYMVHKVASHDIIKLREETKKKNPKTSPECIRKYFFRNREITRTSVHRKRKRHLFTRYALNLLVQVLYIAANIGTFFLLDVVLENKFANFGGEWFQWTQLNHTERHDYLGTREHPKPTNALLPPFGYCEVHTSAKDVKESHADKMKIVCEISQHVLYQYTFILLWLAIIVGILISVIALLVACFKLMNKVTGMRALQEHPDNKKVFKKLTYREMEYLDYLQHNDKTLHGEVMEILRQEQKQSERKNRV